MNTLALPVLYEMLEKVLRNKYIATVHEGDVREEEVGFARRYLRASTMEVMDEVVLYPLGESRPYFLRRRGYIVEVDRRTHAAYVHAERGHVLLAPEAMEALQLESRDTVLIDPVTPKLDLEQVLREVRRVLGSST